MRIPTVAPNNALESVTILTVSNLDALQSLFNDLGGPINQLVESQFVFSTEQVSS